MGDAVENPTDASFLDSDAMNGSSTDNFSITVSELLEILDEDPGPSQGFDENPGTSKGPSSVGPISPSLIIDLFVSVF